MKEVHSHIFRQMDLVNLWFNFSRKWFLVSNFSSFSIPIVYYVLHLRIMCETLLVSCILQEYCLIFADQYIYHWLDFDKFSQFNYGVSLRKIMVVIIISDKILNVVTYLTYIFRE